MTPERAISWLIERFPTLSKRVDEAEDIFSGPHYAYTLLAEELIERQNDQVFLNAVCSFIDDLADSNDQLLEELLVVDLLEGIAQDSDLSKRIKLQISGRAADWLTKVEVYWRQLAQFRDIHGR